MIARDRSQLVQAASLVVVVVGLTYLINTLSALLIPLVVAVFIWFLINAVVHTIELVTIRGRAMPRFLSVSVSILLIFVLVAVLVNVVTSNLALVLKEAPVYQQKLLLVIERAYAYFGAEEPPTIENLIGQINFGGMARTLTVGLTGLVGDAGLITVYVIFLFLEQSSFQMKLSVLAGTAERREEWLLIMRRLSADIRRYVGIKTLVSLLTGVCSYWVMRAVGLDFPFFWAFLIFLLNYIPTIGSIIATIFPTLIALVQFDGLENFVITGVSLTSIQVVIGNILEPRLMGNTLNLSPLVILLSLAYWMSVWGVYGAFLCVPLTVVVLIILSNFRLTRPLAVLASRDGREAVEVAHQEPV